MSTVATKFIAGRYKVPVTMTYVGNRIQLRFGFNRTLITEVKAFDGAQWNPDGKFWHIPNNQRNQFQLAYLQGNNPYAPYDAPLVEFSPNRRLFDHQYEMACHALTRHYCIFAAEMGTGKTLTAIEVWEAIPDLQHEEVWYIGPKSGVKAVSLELIKWQSRIQPRMLTYEQLTKEMKNWVDGRKAPRVLVFDESSKLKTPTAQRTMAAAALADGVRADWKDDGFVILMSGTPAPKTPVDWFSQTEIACPGFLKEGNIHKFKSRLAIIEERENMITGGKYPHLLGWRDSDDRCECGRLKDDECHDLRQMDSSDVHPFKAGVNEVAQLYDRLKGLVIVKFKKDCLDLPDKNYVEVIVKSSPEILRLAMHIKATVSRTVEVLTLLRELSDGFQYTEVETGKTMTCPRCKGAKVVKIPKPKEDVGYENRTLDVQQDDFEMVEIPCDHCGGSGEVMTYARDVQVLASPKDDQLLEDLEAHEECGRLVVWGGFTGTIDKIIKLCIQEGWNVLSVDGRGYRGFDTDGHQIDADELLIAMDASHPRRNELAEKYGKLVFVGHPKAGGMALTLTASPTEIFYSNDYSGEARMQAEDRCHRPGMDVNKGLTIKDYLHLAVDKLALDNLKKKKDLQNISMGEIMAAMERPLS